MEAYLESLGQIFGTEIEHLERKMSVLNCDEHGREGLTPDFELICDDADSGQVRVCFE